MDCIDRMDDKDLKLLKPVSLIILLLFDKRIFEAINNIENNYHVVNYFEYKNHYFEHFEHWCHKKIYNH